MHVVAASLQACRQGGGQVGTLQCQSIADRAGQPAHLRLVQPVCVADINLDMFQAAGRQARSLLCHAALGWTRLLAAALSGNLRCIGKLAANGTHTHLGNLLAALGGQLGEGLLCTLVQRRLGLHLCQAQRAPAHGAVPGAFRRRPVPVCRSAHVKQAANAEAARRDRPGGRVGKQRQNVLER